MTADSDFLFDKSLLCPVETVTDFLIELGMKPRMHLAEINNFSLNIVTVRLTKIMNNLFEYLKIF